MILLFDNKLIVLINLGSSKVPQIYSNEDIQVDYKRETIQQTKNVDIKDEHELYSNQNLHSEDQDELEIPWII
ncbi:unnamed protein product [Rhizophagus irregularis]|uniref:Uncharacterized protein n=1 Tax=Rhizophagus irregularis TaxID=588596 RepID=A0A915YQQ2_9GLOM|nr:unnamed protein product [Rhizophagus irregularis]